MEIRRIVCNHAMKVKYTFAAFWYWLYRFTGRNVSQVYFDVRILLLRKMVGARFLSLCVAYVKRMLLLLSISVQSLFSGCSEKAAPSRSTILCLPPTKEPRWFPKAFWFSCYENKDDECFKCIDTYVCELDSKVPASTAFLLYLSPETLHLGIDMGFLLIHQLFKINFLFNSW